MIILLFRTTSSIASYVEAKINVLVPPFKRFSVLVYDRSLKSNAIISFIGVG